MSDGRLWFQVYAWRDRGLVKEMVDRAARRALRGARPHRRHRRARPPRARRPPRLLAAADDRAAHDRRRRPAPRLDVGVRAQRADPVRQRRRSRRRRRRVAGDAVRLHQHPVRPGALLARRRLAALGVGRPDRAQGRSRPSTTRSSRPTPASRRSRCRTTAAASSTARPPPFSLVAPVADAVGGRIEIICDGGVRRGSDIVKAVAAGATAAHGRARLPLRAGRSR